MPTLGSTATPNGVAFWQGVNTPPNVVASPLVMPAPGGILQQLAIYVRAESGTGTMYGCVWDAGGSLLAYWGPINEGQGSNTSGGQQWYGPFDLLTKPFVPGGSTIYAGWWADEAHGFVTTAYPSGSSIWTTNASFPTSLAGNSSTGHGAIGAYVNYLPVSARVRRSGAWVQTGNIYVRRSGVWTQVSRVRVRRSGAWVDAQ